MGCTLEDGAVVESYGLLAAGAVLTNGSKVLSGQIWAGTPAHYLRDLTPEERETLHEHLNEMRELAKVHSEETEKTDEQIFMDLALRERANELTYVEAFWEQLERINLMPQPSDFGE